MKTLIVVSLAALSLLLGVGVEAGMDRQPDWKPSDVEISPEQFDEYRGWIEEELRRGTTRAELSSRERLEVRELLTRMSGVVNRVDRLEDLDRKSRLMLFNDQERLRVLLGQENNEERQICKRWKMVGSNLPKTICRTVAEWRYYREINQDFMRRHQTSQMPASD